jgi:hypothetical protein
MYDWVQCAAFNKHPAMRAWMNEWMGEWMNGGMGEWMKKWMGEWMNEWYEIISYLSNNLDNSIWGAGDFLF